jgi:sigma-B regulation protein RsbU (phosphoserine phosphatase)
MIKLCLVKGPMKGQVFHLKGDTVFIGRSSKNDIQIRDSTISRKQFKIFKIGKKIFVEDLKSTNGTKINGKPIPPGEGFEASPGDMLSAGDTVIRLDADPFPAASGGFHGKEAGLEDERRSRSPENLELLYRVSELLRRPMGLQEMCGSVLAYLLDRFPRIDRAAILLFENQEGRVKSIIGRTRQDGESVPIHYSHKIVEQVARDKKAVKMSNTAYEEPRDLSESIETLGIRSVLCVPMISKAHIRGAIYLDSLHAPHGFRREDLLLLNSLSGSMAVAIENASLAAGTGSPGR